MDAAKVKFAWLTRKSKSSIGVGLVLSCGLVGLMLIGRFAHRQRLAEWGVNSDSFPKESEWYLLNGNQKLMGQLSAVVAMINDPHFLKIFVFAFFVIFFVVAFPKQKGECGFVKWFQRSSTLPGDIFRSAILSLMATSVLPVSIMGVVLLLAAPALVGEAAGSSSARREILSVQEICVQNEFPCVEIFRDGEIISRGFVIDSSTAQIALFDLNSQEARLMLLEGVEVRSKSPTKHLMERVQQDSSR